MATDELILNQAQQVLSQLQLSVALLVDEIEKLNNQAEDAAAVLDAEVRRLAAVVGVVPAPGRNITLASAVTLVESALEELPFLREKVETLQSQQVRAEERATLLEGIARDIDEAQTNLAFGLGRQGGDLRSLAAEAGARLQSAQDAERLAAENAQLRREKEALAIEIGAMASALKGALGPMNPKSPIEIAHAAVEMIESSKEMIRRNL